MRTRLPEANVLGLHLDRLFNRLAINVVLDVGAGGGDFGRWLRHNGYAGRIASFEPVSDSFERLAHHSARDPKWEAFRMALGSEDRTAEINVSELRVFSSFLERSRYSKDEIGNRRRSCGPRPSRCSGSTGSPSWRSVRVIQSPDGGRYFASAIAERVST